MFMFINNKLSFVYGVLAQYDLGFCEGCLSALPMIHYQVTWMWMGIMSRNSLQRWSFFRISEMANTINYNNVLLQMIFVTSAELAFAYSTV